MQYRVMKLDTDTPLYRIEYWREGKFRKSRWAVCHQYTGYIGGKEQAVYRSMDEACRYKARLEREERASAALRANAWIPMDCSQC